MTKIDDKQIFFVIFILGLMCGLLIMQAFQPKVYPVQKMSYLFSNHGDLYSYIRGDWESYKHALQKALWDLNETGGIIYGDPEDNSTYIIK